MAVTPPPSLSGASFPASVLTGPQGASDDAIRRAQEIARWRRRSLVIRFWRGFLPVIIGVILVGLIGWVVAKTFQSWTAAPVAGGEIRMIHPRFFGRNNKNQPYTITAEEAVRDNRDINRVALTQPRLSMQTDAPGPVLAQSDRGLLNEATHLLQMNGAVKVNDGRGYVFLSESALLDTQTHRAEGHNHVTGDGPLGHFDANAYVIDEKGGHAVLTGQVHTHLLPQGSAVKP